MLRARAQREILGPKPREDVAFRLPYTLAFAAIIFVSGHAFGYYFRGFEKSYGVDSVKTIPIDFFYLRLAVTAPLLVPVLINAYRQIEVLRNNAFIGAFLLFILLSGFWSTDVGVVKSGYEEYLMTYVLCFAFATIFSKADIVKVFCYLELFIVMSTLIWVTLFPNVSVYHSTEFAGKWRGVFLHKNTLGQALGMLLPIVLFFGQGAMPSRIARLLVVVATTLTLVKTGSGSGLVIAAAGITLAMLQRWVKRETLVPLLIVVGPLVVLLALGVSGSAGYILEAFGKDATLTGRTNIWGATFSLMREGNVWLGGGVGSTHSKDYGDRMHSILGFAYDTHNGYLTMIAELGIIGLAAFLGLVGVALAKTVAVIPRESEDLGPTRAFQVLLICWLVAMLVESGPTSPANTVGIVAMISIFALAASPARTGIRGSARPGGRRRYGPAGVSEIAVRSRPVTAP